MNASATELPAHLEAELQRRGIHHRDWIGASHHAVPLRDEFKPEDLNPAFNGNPGFDFETVFANCDGEKQDSAPNRNLVAMKIATRMFSAQLAWVLTPHQSPRDGTRRLRQIGRRAIVLSLMTGRKIDAAVMRKCLGHNWRRIVGDFAADFKATVRAGQTNTIALAQEWPHVAKVQPQ